MTDDGDRGHEDFTVESANLGIPHGELKQITEEVVEENRTGWVDDHRDGDERSISYAVGIVVEKSERRADPLRAEEYLLDALDRIE